MDGCYLAVDLHKWSFSVVTDWGTEYKFPIPQASRLIRLMNGEEPFQIGENEVDPELFRALAEEIVSEPLLAG